MSTLHDQIQQVIDTEPVVVFMKGTPEAPACGNSMRALQALWQAGAPITGVDVLPDPRIRQELTALSEWPTIPQVFVKGELIGGADITEELHASGELKEKIDEALEAGDGERAARLMSAHVESAVRHWSPRAEG
jgi:monothiol glutaredoxin